MLTNSQIGNFNYIRQIYLVLIISTSNDLNDDKFLEYSDESSDGMSKMNEIKVNTLSEEKVADDVSEDYSASKQKETPNQQNQVNKAIIVQNTQTTTALPNNQTTKNRYSEDVITEEATNNPSPTAVSAQQNIPRIYAILCEDAT